MSDERNLPASTELDPSATFLGHPRGLFVLFFVEMWERFSYYGMRALLIFYMTKGFLGFGDKQAYGVYGAYTALVYATPFVGGMLADKLLGQARAVILGGMLMAAGHLLMTFENTTAFFTALALLICGNGFFKPNISTMVGSMYPAGNPKRDRGFTIFYMGINLGAAMSPLLCGAIGETFGWHYGFGLATLGMLAGLFTFVAGRSIARLLIGATAVVTCAGMVLFAWGSPVELGVNAPIGIALLVAAVVAIAALAGGGLPPGLGAAKDARRMEHPAVEAIRNQPVPYYLAIIGTTLLINHVVAQGSEYAVISMLVGLFAILLPWLNARNAVYLGTATLVPAVAILVQNNAVAGLLLTVFGGLAMFKLAADAYQAPKIERERMQVVLILMFFSMLFWAFFEQAGSSLSNFTDRNVNRVVGGEVITAAEVGQKRESLKITSAFLGREIAGRQWDVKLVDAAQATANQFIRDLPKELSDPEIQQLVNAQALKAVDELIAKRKPAETKSEESDAAKSAPADETVVENKEEPSLLWRLNRVWAAKRIGPKLEGVTVTEGMVGMAAEGTQLKASIFQAVNAVFIVTLGLVFSLMWSVLGKLRLEPNSAIKFSLGLLQLGLGFGAVWYGAKNSDQFGMVATSWLLLAYLLHTTGELCLSPVGLSMVTKLSPPRMVSTVMGAWFLATAFSNFLAGMIAALTGVGGHGEGKENVIPPPIDTVHVYGDVFGQIAIAGIVSAVILLALSPLLVRWMHGADQGGGH
jgi:POT family proton-dependent oligopeptide transporter